MLLAVGLVVACCRLIFKCFICLDDFCRHLLQKIITFIIYINNIIKVGRPMPVGKQYEVILMVPDYEMHSVQSSLV